MKHLKELKLNEDILHDNDNVPAVGAKVEGVYKDEEGETLMIRIEGCSPIFLVGHFQEADVPEYKYGDKGMVTLDGKPLKFKSLFHKHDEE